VSISSCHPQVTGDRCAVTYPGGVSGKQVVVLKGCAAACKFKAAHSRCHNLNKRSSPYICMLSLSDGISPAPRPPMTIPGRQLSTIQGQVAHNHGWQLSEMCVDTCGLHAHLEIHNSKTLSISESRVCQDQQCSTVSGTATSYCQHSQAQHHHQLA